MAKNPNGVEFQHKSSTRKGVQKMVSAQNKSSRRVRATASGESGGQGSRYVARRKECKGWIERWVVLDLPRAEVGSRNRVERRCHQNLQQCGSEGQCS